MAEQRLCSSVLFDPFVVTVQGQKESRSKTTVVVGASNNGEMIYKT
jgi:hypothetical protein